MGIPKLNDGELYAGLSRNPDTGAWHHLVLLPATTDKDLNWHEAISWAKSVGGELPTRDESALLYANARDKIDEDYWYWTGTEVASLPSRAWGQYFDGSGYQSTGLKVTHDRARAVRRVRIKIVCNEPHDIDPSGCAFCEIERLRAHIALLDGDVDREVKRAERAETALRECMAQVALAHDAINDALPWMIKLGDYIGNGTQADPMGRCNAILKMRIAVEKRDD